MVEQKEKPVDVFFHRRFFALTGVIGIALTLIGAT
jgi:hypothetical protein